MYRSFKKIFQYDNWHSADWLKASLYLCTTYSSGLLANFYNLNKTYFFQQYRSYSRGINHML